MAYWTTGEIRKLKDSHGNGNRPKRKELHEMLPRHSLPAIGIMAHKLGLRKPLGTSSIKSPKKKHSYWLRIAHLHFSKRESEMRAQ